MLNGRLTVSDVEWFELLPPDLRRAAYRASNGEFAWSRANALAVSQLLRNKGYSVFGVDIWLPTRPGPTIPTPFVYDWTLSADVRSAHCQKSADEFIRNFRWSTSDKRHLGMEPYFNLTVRRLA